MFSLKAQKTKHFLKNTGEGHMLEGAKKQNT
jgi:hypothetical protein